MSKANRSHLNIEGAFQHILNDLYAFIATAVAGLVVILTGFASADAIAALVVAAVMAKPGYGLLRDSGRVLFEAAPRGISPQLVETGTRGLAGVVDVHELHVWGVASGFPALSAHILVGSNHDCHERRSAVEALLAANFDPSHHPPSRPPGRPPPGGTLTQRLRPVSSPGDTGHSDAAHSDGDA